MTRHNSKKDHPDGFHTLLLVLTLFSFLLLSIRICITYSPAYLFLCWNLLLAFIPYLLTSYIAINLRWIESSWKRYLLFLVWLVFIPNAFYMITDFMHIANAPGQSYGKAPQWLDVLILFSFALNGIIPGIISLHKVESVVRLLKGPGTARLVVFGVMLLSGFGIYVGRYLRFNSWDVVANPSALVDAIADSFGDIFDGHLLWMTLAYAAFLSIMYFLVRRLRELSSERA